jgi:hypothetical protein
MEREIGDSHWLAALREMVEHPSWPHLFVKGNDDARHAPLSTVKDSEWEYVVERIDGKLVANTYHMGQVFSSHTYTYIERA